MNHIDKALLTAAKRGDTQAIEQLLAVEANIETTDIREVERTPLLLAAFRGHHEATLLLLEKNANKHYRDTHGNNVLQLAALYGGNKALVEDILGCNITFDTPLHEAAYRDEVEVIEHLFKEIKIDTLDKGGRTALHYAAAWGNTRALEVLVAKGCLVNHPNNNGNTALLQAAYNGQKSTIEWLLSHGASLAEKDNNGYTALLLAAYNGSADVVSLLLYYDTSLAILNQKTGVFGKNALAIAKERGHTEVVKRLEVAPRRSQYYKDALSLLAEDRGKNTIQILEPIQLAAQGGHPVAYEIFIRKQTLRLSLIQKAKIGDWDDLSAQLQALKLEQEERWLFLSTLADEGSGNTLLHYVAEQGQESMIRLLLSYDVTNTHALNNNRQRPFELAKAKGHARLAHLIEHYVPFKNSFPLLAQRLIYSVLYPTNSITLSQLPLDSPQELKNGLLYIKMLYPQCQGLIFEDSLTSKDGLNVLLRTLQENNYHHQLETLGFNHCNITDELFNELLIVLPDFPCLQVLKLSDNKISHDSSEKIKLLIGRCRTLRELDLTENRLDNTGVPGWLSVAKIRDNEIKVLLRGNNINDTLLGLIDEDINSCLSIDLAGNPVIGYKLNYSPNKAERQKARAAFQERLTVRQLFFAPPYAPLSVFRFLPQTDKPQRVFSAEWNVALCAKKGLTSHAFLIIEGLFKSGQYFLFKGELKAVEGKGLVEYEYFEDKYRFEQSIKNDKYNVRLFSSVPKNKVKELKRGIEFHHAEQKPLPYSKWATGCSDMLKGNPQYYNCVSWCITQLEKYHILSEEEKEDFKGWIARIAPSKAAGAGWSPW